MSWLEAQQAAGFILCFSHIANENKSARGRMRAHSLGTRAGVPDYVIVMADQRVIWVEMKRTKGGSLSKEQKVWLSALAPKSGLCYGHQEAIIFVSTYF